jgi:acyl carrier protein
LNEKQLISKILESLVEVAPEISPNEINPSINFRDQFEIDSIDYLNFILTLEKKLNIKIPDLDYPKLSSQAGCISYLSSNTLFNDEY